MAVQEHDAHGSQQEDRLGHHMPGGGPVVHEADEDRPAARRKGGSPGPIRPHEDHRIYVAPQVLVLLRRLAAALGVNEEQLFIQAYRLGVARLLPLALADQKAASQALYHHRYNVLGRETVRAQNRAAARRVAQRRKAEREQASRAAEADELLGNRE